MPRTIETTVYQFDELNDEAKKRAREWWRSLEAQDFWPDFALYDVKQIAPMLGIEFSDHAINMGKGRADDIWWSAGYSQGDGAMFEGHYKNNKNAPQLVREHAPQDEDLHRIADSLFALQAKHFGLLTAKCTRISHHYSHSGCMGVEMGRDDDESGILACIDYPDATPESLAAWRADEEELTLILRSFADWIYRQIVAEYEGSMEDEHVDSCILANEYEFEANGQLAR